MEKSLISQKETKNFTKKKDFNHQRDVKTVETQEKIENSVKIIKKRRTNLWQARKNQQILKI